MKVSELEGVVLDYWVARGEGMTHEAATFVIPAHAYSSEWALGGPIIEREQLNIWPHDEGWSASYTKDILKQRSAGIAGVTPLIASMRAYVAWKFGEEVEGAQPESAG